MSKFIGLVSAYAYAKSKGYTGTEEEFAILMAEYASVTETAVEAVRIATKSAQSAAAASSDVNRAAATVTQQAAQVRDDAETSSESAATASEAKETAVGKALDSEAYALGTRDGEDVGSSDPAYHNNAKYYAEQGGSSAQTASEAAQTATTKAGEAQASAEAAAESARTLTIDRTLTQAGQAADAKATKDRFDEISDESTTKNLCDIEPLKAREGITYTDGVYTGKASDFSSYVLLDSGFEESKRYAISFYGKNNGSNVSGNGLGVRINYTDSSYEARYLPNSTTDYDRFTAVSGTGKTVSSILLYYNSGGANVWDIKQIQIEEGTAVTDYIAHIVRTAHDALARDTVSSLVLNTLKSSDIIIADKSVYSSFDDLPLNKAVLIPYATKLDNGPDGYAYIGHNTLDTGLYNAIVLTFSATTYQPTQIVQICYQYRDIYSLTNQPHTATRYGLMKNGSIVWSDWSILSQDSVLHSSNRVVDIDTYQQVTFGDFNDAPANAIYQVDLNTGTTVLNNPSPGHSGLLMTFAFSPITRHALIQHHYAIENGEITMYFRYSYKNAPDDFRWTSWKKVATDIDDNSYIKNMGKLSSNTDLNTLTDNAVYLLGYNYSYVHRPWETLAGFLTIKTVGSITLQTAESLSGTRKSRSSADGGSTWTEWA